MAVPNVSGPMRWPEKKTRSFEVASAVPRGTAQPSSQNARSPTPMPIARWTDRRAQGFFSGRRRNRPTSTSPGQGGGEQKDLREHGPGRRGVEECPRGGAGQTHGRRQNEAAGEFRESFPENARRRGIGNRSEPRESPWAGDSPFVHDRVGDRRFAIERRRSDGGSIHPRTAVNPIDRRGRTPSPTGIVWLGPFRVLVPERVGSCSALCRGSEYRADASSALRLASRHRRAGGR